MYNYTVPGIYCVYGRTWAGPPAVMSGPFWDLLALPPSRVKALVVGLSFALSSGFFAVLAVGTYISDTRHPPLPRLHDGAASAVEAGWPALRAVLRAQDEPRVIILEARQGIAERLRAISSAMAVAAALRRPLVVVWTRDASCGCPLDHILQGPFPFALLGEPARASDLNQASFQVVDGGERRLPLAVDERRHLYVRTTQLLHHPAGTWSSAVWHLRRLVPRVQPEQLLASSWMVGLEVRKRLTPPVRSGNASVTSEARTSPNALPNAASGLIAVMDDLLLQRNTRFFLSASEASFGPIAEAFPPGVVLRAARSASRCPSGKAQVTLHGKTQAAACAECEAALGQLVDLLNLARTGALLSWAEAGGAGLAAASEVAAQLGGREAVTGAEDLVAPIGGVEIGVETAERLRRPRPDATRTRAASAALLRALASSAAKVRPAATGCATATRCVAAVEGRRAVGYEEGGEAIWIGECTRAAMLVGLGVALGLWLGRPATAAHEAAPRPRPPKPAARMLAIYLLAIASLAGGAASFWPRSSHSTRAAAAAASSTSTTAAAAAAASYGAGHDPVDDMAAESLGVLVHGDGGGGETPRFLADVPPRSALDGTVAGAGVGTVQSAGWHVEGAQAKAGAGILMFAYGSSTKTLGHFLAEATYAARGLREHNHDLAIAIVTNNQSVDARAFSLHIRPRADLLFGGDVDNAGQNRGDNVPRQWLTRLYYIAHSPYEITWVLDSNVASCTPGAAQAFLQAALASQLWGYHLAHASQNVLSSLMYPHNFNIILRWSEVTSAVLRDWLLLAMRSGVTSDDQKTLHLAELRQRLQPGAQLRVGRITPEYGAAFQGIITHQRGVVGGVHPQAARITSVVSGRVHVVHAKSASMCEVFNADADSPRQLFVWRTGFNAPFPSGRRGSSILNYTSLTSRAECLARLGRDDARYCRLEEEESERGGPHRNPYIEPAILEPYEHYAHSTRCGSMCS